MDIENVQHVVRLRPPLHFRDNGLNIVGNAAWRV